MELNGAVKRYQRQREVLRGLDLSIPAGSVVGLLGKNGAGKTTLIKAALGLIKLNTGSAQIFGEDAWKLSAEAKARLGYVPQVVSLYPWMRVGQIADYIGAFYPRWNDALVDRLLREWRVDPLERVGVLSVGTLQKLAIVLALGHEPELLVLDEPAASLDPAARRDFLKALLEIANDGRRTILFSTHITSDLERVADRVAILRDGKIAYHGELDELKEKTKRLHVTSSQPLAASFNVSGALRTRIEGNEALISVRGVDEMELARIERDYGASVRVEDLNLEDIFLELHHE
jgi:ABC-2 type transport system ATP-binding protein